MRKILAVLALLCSATAAHAQCDLNATTANFAAQLTAVAPGQTLCLTQSASYGRFNGVTKTGMVTIQPAAGAVPTFSGGDFSTSVRFFTVKNIEWKGPLEVHPPNGTNMHVILDGVTFANVGHADHEGRLSIIGGGVSAINGNGFQVKNSFFGPGGCSDGIQDSTNGSEIGPNNTFTNITMGGCTEHVDSIQPYASNYIHIHDNIISGSEQGIMSPDGLSTGYLIENNVIQLATGYPCMHIGDSRNGKIINNVCRNGAIRVYGGNQNTPSQNMTVQNNVATLDASACTGCTISNNANPSTVTYVGGPAALRCSWATKTPTGTGTGGTTVGLNTCGTPPPPTAPVISTTSLPNGVVNTAYPATQLTYTGGTGTPAWTSTTLPPGMVLSTAGLLTGLPTVAATSTPSFTVTAGQASAPKVLTINITDTPPPPSFPAPGKRGSVKSTSGANIRGSAVNNGFGVQVGTAPFGATFVILSVSSAVIPNTGGATWVQVDFDDPSLVTGYIGSDNMTEVTGPPPSPTLTLRCDLAKAGFTGTNVPAGTILTINGSIPGAAPVSCTTTF